MATRTRPAGCCTLTAVKRLPKRQLDRAVRIAKALADPNRIEMLRLVARQSGPMCACDIVEHFDLSQPTVSHHLKTLKQAGLLRGTRKGLWAFYELDPEGVGLLAGLAGLLDGQRLRVLDT